MLRRVGYRVFSEEVVSGFRPLAGEGYLTLLGDARTVALMELTAGDALARDELAVRLRLRGGGLARRLLRLVDMGVLVAERLEEDRRCVRYRLAPCGSELLDIERELRLAARALAKAARLESTPPLSQWIGQPPVRLILRALLDGACSAAELAAVVPSVSRHPLQLRLARLRAGGLVQVLHGSYSGTRYALSEHIVLLRRVAVLAARWRAAWTPDRLPRMAGDLLGLLMLLTAFDLLQCPRELCGTLRVHVDPPDYMRTGWHDAELSVAGGRPKLITFDPDALPDAQAHASPLGWCEALLHSRIDGVAIEGDRALAHAVIDAIAAALRL